MGSGPTFAEHEAKVGLVGVPMNVRISLLPEYSVNYLCLLRDFASFLVTNTATGNTRLANGHSLWFCPVP